MEPENEEFARLVREAGWTQLQTAKELDLNRVTVNRIINGGQKVSKTVLRLLVELTGGAIHLPGETHGSRTLSQGETMYRATGLEHDLLQCFRQLRSDERNLLFETARQFVVAHAQPNDGVRGSKPDNSSRLNANPLIDNNDSRGEKPLKEAIRPAIPKVTPPPFVPFSQKQKDRWERSAAAKSNPQNK